MPKKSSLVTRKHIRHHVDKKLQTRLRLYFLISVVLVCIAIYEVVTGVVGIAIALLSLIAGVGLGILTARMYHLSWDHDAKKIISRLDLFGIIILALYILFAIFRTKIIGHFIHGPAVGGASLSIVAGIMVGRVIGTRGKIAKILREQKVF